MRIVRAADGRRTPWKNGGGETVEIAVDPPGAEIDAFDWRVSVAVVAADGPFSPFPGVDRTLAVLTGDGLELAAGRAAPVRLTPANPPFAFPADDAFAARLLGGPATVLNVMSRRGRFVHALRRLDVAAPVALDGGTTLVFCAEGRIAVGGTVLEQGDALMPDAPAEVAARGGVARLLTATFRPA